jgi:hypothetical protein
MTDYFGGCPFCGRNSGGYINVGRSHWGRCDEHRVKWCIGSNLFSDWQQQTEQAQKKIYDDIGMGGYRHIQE